MPRQGTICGCGCGLMTKSGPFLRGHQLRVRHHSRGKGLPLADRLWPKVIVTEDPDACDLWTGYLNAAGYGRIFSGPPRNVQLLVTHAVLELAGIPVKPGDCVLHSCDTPACVSLRHLRIDDRAANAHEMWERGRSNWQTRALPDSQGERNINAKLTAEIVLELRRRYAHGGTTYERLAQERELSLSTVHRAITGLTWKHL